MSSSSKSNATAAPEDADDSHDLLTQLLGGIAKECSAIGTSISEVGDDLSEALTSTDMTRVMLECQAFDRLSQIAHAQARLIEYIGRLLLNGDAASSKDLVHAIEGVPTFDVRERLCAAIGVDARAQVAPAMQEVAEDEDGLF